MIYQNTFEPFNPKGRRGSRKRKESAALRREWWRLWTTPRNPCKNLPEQESCIPTGRAMAADPRPVRRWSTPFLPPFFRSILGRHFFHFCAFLASPGGPQNHQKSPKIDLGSLPCSELMHFMHFHLILVDFE